MALPSKEGIDNIHAQYVKNIAAKVPGQQTIRAYVGGREFGEIIHMAAFTIAAKNSGHKIEIDLATQGG